MKPVIRLRAKGHSNLKLEIDLAEAGSITGGVGGWAKVTRPKKQSLTEWQGHEGYEMTVPVIFDGLAEDRSVESDITRLERMGRRRPGDEHPPILDIGGPLPHVDLPWVLQDIDWGEFDRREDGQRVRQIATLTLWEYVHASLSTDRKGKRKKGKSHAKDARDRNKGKSANRRHKVKKNEASLGAVATNVYGDPSMAKEIADLNDIRDPWAIVVGQELRLP